MAPLHSLLEIRKCLAQGFSSKCDILWNIDGEYLTTDNDSLIAWFRDAACAYDCDFHLVSRTGDDGDDIDGVITIDEHHSYMTMSRHAMG